jgi:hypothetical protein
VSDRIPDNLTPEEYRLMAEKAEISVLELKQVCPLLLIETGGLRPLVPPRSRTRSQGFCHDSPWRFELASG